MTEPTVDSGKDAYVQAQKKRNLFIGLALAGFVVLVFFVSMTRMAQGIRNDATKSAAMSASHAAAAKPAGQ